MGAAPVGVDRPAERHPGRLRDLVDDPSSLDVEELHAPELASTDVALDLLLDQGTLPAVVVGKSPTQLGHGDQCNRTGVPYCAEAIEA